MTGCACLAAGGSGGIVHGCSRIGAGVRPCGGPEAGRKAPPDSGALHVVSAIAAGGGAPRLLAGAGLRSRDVRAGLPEMLAACPPGPAGEEHPMHRSEFLSWTAVRRLALAVPVAAGLALAAAVAPAPVA